MIRFETGKTYQTIRGMKAVVGDAHPKGFVGVVEVGNPMDQVAVIYKPDGTTLMEAWREFNLVPGAIEDLPKPDPRMDQIDKLEAVCTDLLRQLRMSRETARHQSEAMAGMASKIGQDGERLDGIERRIAELAHAQAGAEASIKASGIDNMARSVIGEFNKHADRMTTIEASIARLEDAFTAQKPPEMMMVKAQAVERKSLGWVNVIEDGEGSMLVDDRFSPTRDHADACARMAPGRKRLACIEIFEGDGL